VRSNRSRSPTSREQKGTADRKWFESLFEGRWYRFDSRGHEDTEAEARALAAFLGLERGAELLDVPCGWGRVAVPLAREGYRVTGVDLSPRLIARARHTAARSGLPFRALEGDMRRLRFRDAFDAALCLYSSFGFFEAEPDNIRVMRGLARAVRPGGQVLLEGMARDWLAAHWQAQSFVQRDDVRILEDRTFDHRTSRAHSRWEFQRIDLRTERAVTVELHQLSLRIYTPGELVDMAEKVGLKVTRLAGSYDGREYAFDSRRLILIARKPARRARSAKTRRAARSA
jgi:2-polyprenyl-3-methyl-5-hydroxy-6-metoxy-1,4-benzoquinol methylase